VSSRLLIANRGEIAVRVARAADAIDLPCVAVFAGDDATAPHVEAAAQAVTLGGEGPAAYLDADAIVAAALETGCTHVHPGWGFLSERASFARACADAALVFVGPSPAVLEHLGDKIAARALAQQLGVPVPQAVAADAPDAARAFMAELGGPIMLKAVAGGGGRGMRAVLHPDALDDAWRRCAAEAQLATGAPALYAEQLVARARHVEVQLAGDGTGDVVALGDRDCSLQRRHQKLVEIAPAPDLPEPLRAALAGAAVTIGRELRLAGLTTCEFLVDLDDPEAFVFIEANPRLQVEHTVTEEVLGIDLVAAQLRLALGSPLDELGLAGRAPTGFAVQARVNAEQLGPDGAPLPASGTLTRFDVPAGVRVDTAARAGMSVDARYDTLLAKVIGCGPSLAAALDATRDGLLGLRIGGVDTNADLLAAILTDDDVRAGRLATDLLEDRIRAAAAPEAGDGGGPVAVQSPLTGVVVDVVAPTGTMIAAGAPVLVVEAMKMHHEVVTPVPGEVAAVAVHPGNQIHPGDALFVVMPGDVAPSALADAEADHDTPRDDLAAVLDRRAGLLDDARPDAVRKRRDRGRRTARENLDDLVDDGTFSEYGGLVVAAQRARRSEEDLIANTPGDGIVLGTAEVGGIPTAVLSYDYTVMAGTQGYRNHQKTDRLLDLAARRRLPMVVFVEGGGGRPGDTDFAELFQLTVPTFANFARLSGLVPRIGIVSGNCFAGNAALAGCCDVLITTPEASLGMGGPAMIEGGGLGRFAPEDVGPMTMQAPNGVIDVLADDEADAVATARRVLALLAGPAEPDWSCADQRELRALVPEDPKRIHDARAVVETLCDIGSVVELRRAYGAGMVTALARIEGRPVGVIANDPTHLSGALDAEASEKGGRFVQLCDAFGLPIVSLVDTPGFMVGPDAESAALVRRASRLFVSAATVSVPWLCVVVRRAYGLGAQAMAGGGFHVPVLNVAWPTGEFGAMGVEGAVRLALRRELEAIEDEAEREQRVRDLVEQVRAQSGALTMAAHFEIDDVIDPAETRARLVAALRAFPVPDLPATGRRRTMVDVW
jgi:acetyl/propionyl-CoA carboxylase alpha subunit/acetyl-CoA carboxylase carboxyltransferase component